MTARARRPRTTRPRPTHLAADAAPGARLTYEQAARYLALHVSTLRSLVCRRQVPHIRLTERLVVFERGELDAWLAAKAVRP